MPAPRLAVALLLSLVLAPGPAAAQQDGRAPMDTPLEPGDVIELAVWQEEGYSGTFRVDPRGVVVLPVLGRLDVTGRAPRELQEVIVAALARTLAHEAIEVHFLRRVSVFGAVREAGVFEMDPTLTPVDAVALAGGVAPEGDPRRLELLRGGRSVRLDLEDFAGPAYAPVRSGDRIVVPERSWFARNSATVAGLASGLVSAVLILVTRN